MKILSKIFFGFGRGLRNGLVALGALAFVGTGIALGDFLATVPGSGTNFASVGITVSTVLAQYTAQLLCDFTAGKAQCAAVNSSGQVAVQAPPGLGTTADVPCTLPASATVCSQISVAKAEANAINSPPPLGTAGGITPLKLNALTNGAIAIKASAGQLLMLQCGNTNASEAYVQVYNVAFGSVSVGTTAPTLSIPIAATSTGGFALSLVGLQFGTAISAAATTTATGGTGPSTALDCNVGYN